MSSLLLFYLNMKICSKCKIPKELELFSRDKSSKDGRTNQCKVCVKAYKNTIPKEKSRKQGQEWRENNKEYVKQKSKEYHEENGYGYSYNNYKRYYEKNKVEINAKCKIYREKNKDKRKASARKNRKKTNTKHREQYKNDIQFKIRLVVRNQIKGAIKKYFGKKENKSFDLLGCTIEFYIKYLESLFLPEMTWLTYGTLWEIDHIKPCASFDMTNQEEQFKCFHYSNTQPLFVTTAIAESLGYKGYIGNRDKSDRILN